MYRCEETLALKCKSTFFISISGVFSGLMFQCIHFKLMKIIVFENTCLIFYKNRQFQRL